MLRAVLRSRVPEEQVAKWAAKHPTSSHYDVLISGNAEFRRPDGETALVVCRNVLSEQAVEKARPVFHWMRRFKSDNRSKYAGALSGPMLKEDGTRSRSSRALDADGNRVEVASMIAGYYEHQGGRHPFCRASGFLRNSPEKWEQVQPLIRECGKVYRIHAAQRYKKQMDVVKKTHPAWVIPGSPFTTITVNNTVPAAYHQDGGDLKDGLGVMTVIDRGEYGGFELVVPEYRIAVRLRTGDVILFDPTVWHGNVKPCNQVGVLDEDWYRISVVLYYRKGIIGCLSPEDELARAKSRGAL